MDVKYRRNITFLEARKIVKSSMKDNTYANVAQNPNPVSINRPIQSSNKKLKLKKTSAARTKEWLKKNYS